MNIENEQEFFQEENLDSGINIKELIGKFLHHWFWFVLGLMLSFIIAFVYLRYQIPIYQAKATVLIKDEKKGGALSELSAFSDLNIMSGSSSLDNEIEIFKSRNLMSRVVRDLNLQTSYLVKGNVIQKELYTNLPFKVIYYGDRNKLDNSAANFSIKIIDNKYFEFTEGDSKVMQKKSFSDSFKTSVGTVMMVPNQNFILNWTNKDFIVKLRPINAVVNSYLSILTVKTVSKTASLIELTFNDRSKEKAKDIINNLIFQHNQDVIDDKNQISKNTASFINDRLTFITNELSNVESSAQQYKQSNNVVDVASEAKLYLESDQLNEQRISELSSQQKVADNIYNYITRNNNTDLIPTNFGIADGNSAANITSYNQLILERNQKIKTTSEIHPAIIALDEQINSLRQNVISGVQNYRNSLQIQRNALAKQSGLYSSKISSVPRYERQIKSISRQQEIKEGLYLYLLQKREETNIALAVTVANAKTIDPAFSNGSAIFPDKKKTYTLALVFGLLLPVLLIYLKQIFDTKVHSIKDLEKLNMPFAGDIPLADYEEHLIITKGLSSSIAEAFRMARTNIDFLTSSVKDKAKTVLVTSTLPGEGKSFVSLNLAATISLTNKKVVLVGMDLRAPKLLEYLNLNIENPIGVTNFIIDDQLTVDDIILKRPTKENIDVVLSGDVPPNPSELLLDSRT